MFACTTSSGYTLKSILSLTGSELLQNPLKVRDKIHLEWRCSDSYPGYGKWLIFRNLEDLNKTKELIYDEIKSGRLKVVGMKCSTLYYNPLRTGGGPTTTGRISVFTNKGDYIEIGKKLVKLVQHDIKYKVEDEDKYVHSKGNKERITSTTIFWNDGCPYAATELRSGAKCCPPPCRNDWHGNKPDTDKWKINVVEGQDRFDGKWILVPNDCRKESDKNITNLWHQLRAKIEAGEMAVIKMECPAPKRKGALPEIHVSTSQRNAEAVGWTIISMVKDDIKYRGRERGDNKTLFWNDGKPRRGTEPQK